MCVSTNNSSLRYSYKTVLSSTRATAEMKMKVKSDESKEEEEEEEERVNEGSEGHFTSETGGMRQEEA